MTLEVGSSAGSADVTGGSAVSVSRPLATGSELRRLRFVGGKLRRSVRDLLLKFSRGPSRDPNSSWWQDEAKDVRSTNEGSPQTLVLLTQSDSSQGESYERSSEESSL